MRLLSAVACLCIGPLNVLGQDGQPITLNLDDILPSEEELAAEAARTRELFETNPHYRAHVLGDRARDAGDLAEALEQYELAIELEADDQAAYLKKGGVLLRTNRFEEALEAYRTSIKFNVRGPVWAWQAYSEMGYALGMLGRMDEAEAAFNESIALNPTASAYLGRGNSIMAHRELDFDQYERALADFEEVLRRAPNAVPALVSKGMALLRLDGYEPGYYDEGCESLSKACDLGECRAFDEFCADLELDPEEP